MTTISPATATKMGFDLTQPARWMDIVSVHQIEKLPIFRLERLQIGGRKVNSLEVAIMQRPPSIRVEGLLGINFLRHFRPTFEFDQATLVLRSTKE